MNTSVAKLDEHKQQDFVALTPGQNTGQVDIQPATTSDKPLAGKWRHIAENMAKSIVLPLLTSDPQHPGYLACRARRDVPPVL